MQSDRLRAAAVVVLVLAMPSGACGGKNDKPPLTPTPADEIPGATADGKSGDSPADPGAGASSSPDGAGSGAAAPNADAPPAPISCIALGVCSEVVLGGKEAADARDRCKAASGEATDLPCNHDGVAATCTVESKKLTIFYYKEKNPERMRGLMKGGKDACANAGGKFSAAPPTAGAGAGAGAGKKKPARKK